VKEHTDRIKHLFGVTPAIFRNTELIYNDEIGRRVLNMGFSGILSEGCESVLGDRSPCQLYHHPDEGGIKLLLRNNQLSDDIAFRFHDGKKSLSVEQYMGWLRGLSAHERVVVLGIDYETFGEHYKASSGIQAFLGSLLVSITMDKRFKLSSPSDVLRTTTSSDRFTTEDPISWADKAKDVTAWLGNEMQTEAYKTAMALESDVKKSHNASSLTTWRHLLTSDHFYYMAIKSGGDASVHSYFSHYKSPYDAFINYFNILSDFAVKVKNETPPDDSEASKQFEIERRTHLPPAWVEERAAAYKYDAVMGER
jgi:alpha-amylase